MLKMSLAGKALSILGAAFMFAAGNAAAQARGEMDVNFGYYPGATFHLPQYVAEAKGYYKQAGLNATMIAVANGPLMN